MTMLSSAKVSVIYFVIGTKQHIIGTNFIGLVMTKGRTGDKLFLGRIHVKLLIDVGQEQ